MVSGFIFALRFVGVYAQWARHNVSCGRSHARYRSVVIWGSSGLRAPDGGQLRIYDLLVQSVLR